MDNLAIQEWFSLPVLGSAAMIFILRVLDISLYTLRILFTTRGRKELAWVSAFCQSIIYISVITQVLKHVDNLLILIGYAAGFATGNVVGMAIERKLAIGHTNLRIISSRRGSELAEKLRWEGHAVTEVAGRGWDGTVDILVCGVLRKHTDKFIRTVQSIDPDAFITAEELRSVRRGFWRS